MQKGVAIYAGICVLGLCFGAAMATYIFSGLITLAAFFVLVNTVPPLKWLVYYFGGLIDVLMYGFTLYAMFTTGITAGMAMTVASAGYTLILRPYIRDTYR
jgi:hypothetical protein